jgi:hypothetical protein
MKTSSRLNLPFSLVAAGLARMLPIAILLLSTQTTRADSATWLLSAQDNAWVNPNNWTPGGPPNGPFDVATFVTSNRRTVNIDGSVEVNSIVFTGDFFAFNINPDQLIVSGAGIISNHIGSTFSIRGG